MITRPRTRKLDRALAVLASLAAVAALGFATSAAAEQNLRLSTLGPGSSPYIVMNTFANIVNEKVPGYSIQVNATGAATRHAIETAQGRSHFFMSAASVHQMMTTETGPFEKVRGASEMAKDLRTVFNFPIGYYHVVTFADSGITSFDDFKGKRVFLGPPGSAAYRTSELIVEGMTGFKADEDYRVATLGWDAAAQSFQDGHIDVYFNPTLPPAPVITQIALTNKIRLLSIPDEMVDAPGIKKMLARPGFRFENIPAGVYGDNQLTKGEIRAVGAGVGVGTSKDVPEEVIYQMTKAFWENLEERAKHLPILRNITLEQAFLDIHIPLHPGALRYYRELGLSIPPAALGE